MNDPSDPQDLARKLVATFHLSMPERAVFGGKPVPGSLIRSAILCILDEAGRFPPQWERDGGFDGGLIECHPDGSYTLTWKAEVGMMRFRVMEVQTFPSAKLAVNSYAERFFGPDIDGVRVDWRS